ncbi:MAG: hypothetical protein ACK5RO_07555 [Pseudobdellovibrionaceae bacterium]
MHFILGLMVICLSVMSQAAVWTNQNSWNTDYEKKYQEWVRANWTADYFTKPGPFQNVKLDCADAVYALRMIFSYENKLPFVMNDPTGGRKKISNEMSRWDAQPEAQRARSFLLYLFGVLSTASLPDDSYPVSLQRSVLNSGSFILTDRKNHHAWTIHSFSQYGIPFLIYGSRPPTTKLYTRNEYPTVGFLFPNGINPASKAGFRNFKQPEQLSKPSLQVSGASLEQYELPSNRWSSSIQKKMAMIDETAEARAERLLETACQSLKDRISVVIAADGLNRKLGSQCMDATQYDDFSTPNRDQRFLGNMLEIQSLAGDKNSLSSRTLQKLESVLSGEISGADSNAFCRQEVQSGLWISLGQASERIQKNKLSSNPMDAIERRWGFSESSSEKARRCPQY